MNSFFRFTVIIRRYYKCFWWKEFDRCCLASQPIAFVICLDGHIFVKWVMTNYLAEEGETVFAVLDL